MRFLKIKSNYAIILIAVTVLLIFLHFLGVLSPFENLAVKILTPIQTRIYYVGTIVNETFLGSSSIETLEQQNQKLNKDIEKLTLENAQLKILENENENLRNQLHLIETYEKEYISCRVITRQFDDNANILILNCGSAQGIEKGMPAIVGEGIIVGTITDIKPNLSSLLLISSKTSKIATTILNVDNTSGIVTGGQDMSLKMEFIPVDLAVGVGDIVVTSSLEKKIPQNLVIGTIENVSFPPNSFFQTADIKQIVNFENINIVSIILPPKL
ncbi:rod shape-determining protein MreC [Patescibacteria group bacterium]|nr:rod shape-determining protein MreC [Patescibacteria group bacterium]